LVKGDLPAAETAAREAVRLKDNSPAIGILGEVLRKQKNTPKRWMNWKK